MILIIYQKISNSYICVRIKCVSSTGIRDKLLINSTLETIEYERTNFAIFSKLEFRGRFTAHHSRATGARLP